MRQDAARAITPDLKSVDMAGKVQTLLSGWSSIDKASYTPDGSRIVFIGRPNNGKPIGSKADLYALDLASGALECRTAELDVGVGGRLSMDMPIAGLSLANVIISDDGESAYATVQRGGTDHIYRIALSGDELCQPVTEGDCAVFPLDRQGELLLYARASLNAPPDLHMANIGKGDTQRLTRLNDDFLDALDLPQSEHLHWQSVDGVAVEGWFMRPPQAQAPYPTILYIHGGPHAAYGYGFHFDFQMLAGAGYGVLFLNHRASTGYGDSFSTAIKSDWGQSRLSGLDDRRRPCHRAWLG